MIVPVATMPWLPNCSDLHQHSTQPSSPIAPVLAFILVILLPPLPVLLFFILLFFVLFSALLFFILRTPTSLPLQWQFRQHLLFRPSCPPHRQPSCSTPLGLASWILTCFLILPPCLQTRSTT